MDKIAEILDENTESKCRVSVLDRLVVENGNAKLNHYSNTLITDGFISITGKQNFWSSSEFRNFGASRCFFYGFKEGVARDRGVPHNSFLYLCEIPVDKIYPIYENPDGFYVDPSKPYLMTMLRLTREAGYTAWAYYLNGDVETPIVISFENIPINEMLIKLNDGIWYDYHGEYSDSVIGEMEVDGVLTAVYHRHGTVKALSNTYYIIPKYLPLVYKKYPEFYEYESITFHPGYEMFGNYR